MYETCIFFYIMWGEDYCEYRLILSRTILGTRLVCIEDLEMSSLKLSMSMYVLPGKTSHTLSYTYPGLKTMHLSDPYVA